MAARSGMTSWMVSMGSSTGDVPEGEIMMTLGVLIFLLLFLGGFLVPGCMLMGGCVLGGGVVIRQPRVSKRPTAVSNLRV